jgi:hypothetical protein
MDEYMINNSKEKLSDLVKKLNLPEERVHLRASARLKILAWRAANECHPMRFAPETVHAATLYPPGLHVMPKFSAELTRGFISDARKMDEYMINNSKEKLRQKLCMLQRFIRQACLVDIHRNENVFIHIEHPFYNIIHLFYRNWH